MKYLILVSHGEFSQGLKQSLSMFAADNMDSVIAVGLLPGEAADTLGKRFEQTLDQLPNDSQFVVLADIIGGSPLTTISNILGKRGKLADTLIFGGMNFPMALTALMAKDSSDNSELEAKVLSEASNAVKVFKVQTDDDDDDEI